MSSQTSSQTQIDTIEHLVDITTSIRDAQQQSLSYYSDFDSSMGKLTEYEMSFPRRKQTISHQP